MSFIFRDTLTPQISTTAACSRMYHRFDKMWPKLANHYESRYYFYYGGQYQKTDNLVRFLSIFGVSWEEFSANSVDKEIDSIYFYLKSDYEWDGSYALVDDGLNDSRATTSGKFPTTNEMVEMFNNSLRPTDPPNPPYPERASTETDEEFKVRTDEWDEIVENRLEDMEIELTIHYGLNKKYIDAHNLGWSINNTGVIESTGFNFEEIVAITEADPWYYLANARSVQDLDDSKEFQLYDGADYIMPKNHPNNPSSRLLSSCDVTLKIIDKEESTVDIEYELPGLGIFAMMDNGVSFEPVGDIYDISFTTQSTTNYDGEAMQYTYKRKFVYHGIDKYSKILEDINTYFEASKQIDLNYQKSYSNPLIDKISANAQTTTYTQLLQSLKSAATNGSVELFSPPFGNFNEPKLNRETARRMKRRDFAEMLANSLDSKHVVKKAETWEKVLAVVIVIIAIVVVIYTGGAAAAAVGNMMALSTSLGYGAVALAIGGMALSYFGGASAAGLVKIVGNIAMIVGIAAMLTGIAAALNNAGRIAVKAAGKAAGKSMTEQAVTEAMASRTLIDNVGSFITQSLDSVTSKITNFVSMDFTSQVDFVFDSLDTLNKGLDMYQDSVNKELQAEYNELIAEEDAYNKENLNNALKNPAAVYTMSEDRLSSYDAITEIQIMLDSKHGRDDNYTAWDVTVNSV